MEKSKKFQYLRRVIHALMCSVVTAAVVMAALILNVSVADAATPISGFVSPDSTVYIDTNGTRLVISKAGYTLDGYDMGGTVSVYINADNVQVKNCVNVAKITTGGSVTGAVISNNTVTGSGILCQNGGVSVTGNTVSGSGNYGIYITGSSNTVSGNTVKNFSGNDGIRAENISASAIDGNTITNITFYGMEIIGDNGSTVTNNTIDTVCTGVNSSQQANGFLLYNSTGTQISGNSISNVKSTVANWGNGLMAAYSSGVSITGNTVTNAANHGIEISWQSSDVTVSNNTVTGSANGGISLTRGVKNITVDSNNVSSNTGYGVIVNAIESYKLEIASMTKDIVITACVNNNTLAGNTTGGLFVSSDRSGSGTVPLTVEAKGNTINNNDRNGIIIQKDGKVEINGNKILNNNGPEIAISDASDVSILNNNISRDSFDADSYAVNSSNCASLNISGNMMYNHGRTVYVDTGTTLTLTNNQAYFAGTAIGTDLGKYVYVAKNYSSFNTVNDSIYKLSIGNTSTTVGAYIAGIKAGVVINGQEITTTTSEDGGIATVSYASTDTAGIVAFVVDDEGNSICYNAPSNFVLSGTGATAPDHDKIVDFVTRLYNVCLDREPDETGLNNWVNALASGEKTGVDVASGFIFSTEFNNHNYCNSCYVEHLYNAFMGRASDPDGKAYWINNLETGMTREEVFNGFALSNEFKNICDEYGIVQGAGLTIPEYGTVPKGSCCTDGTVDGVTSFVTRLYNVCLDRDPDAEGLNNWTNALWNHETKGSTTASGFIFSQEFTNKNYDDETYVEYLYRAFFDRASDSAGKADWVSKLQNGASREEVFNGFTGSQEFITLCAKYGITR